MKTSGQDVPVQDLPQGDADGELATDGAFVTDIEEGDNGDDFAQPIPDGVRLMGSRVRRRFLPRVVPR